MKAIKDNRFKHFYEKPLLYSGLLGLFFAAISILIISILVTIYSQNKMDSVQAQMEAVKSRINKIQKLTDLEVFNLALQITENGEVENLDSIGRVVLERNKFIIGIEIVPGGVISEVYPYEQHKAAIGLNILDTSTAKREALMTIANKQIHYAGPLPLKQGGLAIVARLPIFVKGIFWGFSAILIDSDRFFEEIKLNEPIDENLHISFTKLDSAMMAQRIWNPNVNNYQEKLSFLFEQSNWKITIYSKIGTEAYLLLLVLIVSGLLVTFFSSYSLFEFLKRPILLERLLNEKTKELLKQNKYFSSLIDAIPDFIYIIGKDGVLMSFHSSGKDSTMNESKNFIGKNVADYFEEELSKRIMGKINFTLGNDEITRFTYNVNVNSELEYFEARIVKINETEALVFVRKITRLVNINRKLHTSESKYRLLVQQAPDFIFQTDSKGKILNVNHAGYKLTGFGQEDLLKKNINQCLHFNEEVIDIIPILKFSGDEAKEALLVTKKGEKIAVEVSASITNDGSILGIIRDITERKKYIDSIENQNAQLREIAWKQSHEVRGPLAKIMTLVEFMKHHYKEDNFKLDDFLNHLTSASVTLDETIKDIVIKSDNAVKNKGTKAYGKNEI